MLNLTSASFTSLFDYYINLVMNYSLLILYIALVVFIGAVVYKIFILVVCFIYHKKYNYTINLSEDDLMED